MRNYPQIYSVVGTSSRTFSVKLSVSRVVTYNNGRLMKGTRARAGSNDSSTEWSVILLKCKLLGSTTVKRDNTGTRAPSRKSFINLARHSDDRSTGSELRPLEFPLTKLKNCWDSWNDLTRSSSNSEFGIDYRRGGAHTCQSLGVNIGGRTRATTTCVNNGACRTTGERRVMTGSRRKSENKGRQRVR